MSKKTCQCRNCGHPVAQPNLKGQYWRMPWVHRLIKKETLGCYVKVPLKEKDAIIIKSKTCPCQKPEPKR